MLFTSYTFVVFTAAVILLYYIVPKKLQWPLLLAASLAFYWYADPTGLPRYLGFMLVTALSAWGCALLIGSEDKKSSEYLAAHKADLTKEDKKAYKDKVKKKKAAIMAVCLLFNLGILAVTKYTEFFINNINALITKGRDLKVPDLIIPMGISFYTFRTLGYIIDVKRGTVKPEKNFAKLLLFISFFPQIVQGPISRWNNVAPTLFAEHSYKGEVMLSGVLRILFGYFKKLLVAERLVIAVKALTADPETYSGIYVFAAMIFYAAELYCDFTGGIDITIGIAECMGIKLEENFELPFFSKNIKEYWNRWHITMGSWFTDYIFYPLSVSPKMLRLSKKSREKLGNAIGKRITVYISCFLVWLATGVWHGAAWNFIVWGLMNFVVIMASQELEPLYAKFHGRFGLKKKKGYAVFEIIRTFLLMSMIRMFDVYRDVPLTFRMVWSMFARPFAGTAEKGALMDLGLTGYDYAVVGASVAVIFALSLYKALKGEDIRKRIVPVYPLALTAVTVLIIVVLVFGAYGQGYEATQFIYNQF